MEVTDGTPTINGDGVRNIAESPGLTLEVDGNPTNEFSGQTSRRLAV